VGRLDRSIFSLHGERPAEASAAHPPFAADPQIGLDVRGLKTVLATPPLLALLGIDQRLEDALSWRFDDYLLNDCFVCINCRHRSSTREETISP
jgi:hypothetical protein